MADWATISALATAGGTLVLALALRNVGNGIAVLHGWPFYPGRRLTNNPPAPLDEFVRLSRDLYVAPGDVGFWQGAFRDPTAPEFAAARKAIEARQPVAVDVPGRTRASVTDEFLHAAPS